MSDSTGRYIITFNGEIYNYQALRDELLAAGHEFRSRSDTEVILRLYSLHGPRMLERLRGMFGLAIWDTQDRTLLLARDALGIKPLYVADDGQTLAFASQVKPLLESCNVDTSPEPAAHFGYFLLGHVPEPYTLYKGIRSLPAGSYMLIENAGSRRQVQYYDPKSWLLVDPVVGNRQELREALVDTIRHHYVADVPVSLFLSAGKDSTTMLALASEADQPNVKAVTLGFKEFAGTQDDETILASEVAQQYDAEHIVHFVTKDQFRNDIDTLYRVMDQPSVDGANTYFVCRVAAEHGVKVAMSGLGADEVFGGYPSFFQVPKMTRNLGWSKSLPFLGRGFRKTVQGLKLHPSPKFAGLVEYGSSVEMAYLLRRGLYMPWEIFEFLDPDFARTGWETLDIEGQYRSLTTGLPTTHAKVAMLEFTSYMQHRLLRDSDWASMASSLELRVPFVDTEFLQRIGPWVASSSPPNKNDMALCPKNPLPQEVLNKPKTGFNIPVADWTSSKAPGSEPPLRQWSKLVYRQFAGSDMLVKSRIPA